MLTFILISLSCIHDTTSIKGTSWWVGRLFCFFISLNCGWWCRGMEQLRYWSLEILEIPVLQRRLAIQTKYLTLQEEVDRAHRWCGYGKLKYRIIDDGGIDYGRFKVEDMLHRWQWICDTQVQWMETAIQSFSRVCLTATSVQLSLSIGTQGLQRWRSLFVHLPIVSVEIKWSDYRRKRWIVR